MVNVEVAPAVEVVALSLWISAIYMESESGIQWL
jgi:hypothetical protein